MGVTKLLTLFNPVYLASGFTCIREELNTWICCICWRFQFHHKKEGSDSSEPDRSSACRCWGLWVS